MNTKKYSKSIRTPIYTVLVLAIFIFSFGGGNSSPVYAQSWTSTHEITYFQGNKPGAVSITFDDGYPSQINNGVAQLNARGLKGTFFLITDWVGIAWQPWPNWSAWQTVADQGHEVASHTVTHPYLSTVSEEQMRLEFSISQALINQNIVGHPCITLAYPYADSNDLVQTVVADYYVAARGSWAHEGGFVNYYESGQNRYDVYHPLNFYNTGSIPMDTRDITDGDFNFELDEAALNHAWLTLMFHDVPDAAAFASILDYVQGKDIYWIDTFGNVARYMKERMNSTVQVVTDTPSQITIDVVMDSSLPTSLYNVPLTIRSTVPFSWSQVLMQQGGNVQTLTPTVENGEKVVYYNALPNGGDIVLTQPNPVPGLTSLDPSTAYVGGDAFTLTVTGSNFIDGSVVRWNNSDRATTYVSDTQLTASISAADIASIGTAKVKVFNPAPGGGTSGQLSLSITARPVTVTVDTGQSKVYGTADPAFTYTSSDPAVAFTGSLSRASGENAGSYTINRGTLTPVDSHYAITDFVSANFTITPANATVNLSNLNYQYDGTQKSVTVTTSPAGLPVSVTYNGSTTAPKKAGNYAVAATVSGNYAGTASDTLVISKATVSPTVSVSDKTYDGTTSGTVSGRSLSGVISPDVVSLSGGTAVFADKNAGTGHPVTVSGLTLSGADSGNYQLSSTSVVTSANVAQRPLAVSASGVNKVYDGTTTATVSLSDNRVSGDGLTTNYAVATYQNANVGNGKTISVNGIYIAGGADADNYVLGNTTTSTTANITIAGQTINVTTHAPTAASDGKSFNVAATSNSGLGVAITTSGSCSGSGTGSATISMTSGSGLCNVFYKQSGNGNYSPAAQVQETVSAIQKPTVTLTTSDSSLTGQSVTVGVSVVDGVSGAPTGTVVIGGADTNCAITLANGSGNCNVVFNFSGSRTLTAEYSGDAFYAGNTASKAHQVSMAQLSSNGGFNSYSGTSKIPTSWVGSTTLSTTDGKDTSTKKEGTMSFKLTGNSTTKTLTQTLPMNGVAGQKFDFSYWVKRSAMSATGICQGQVFLYSGTTLKSTVTLKCPSGTTYDWKNVSVSFTAPTAYDKVVVQFTYGKAGGTVWFDSVSLMR
jgi:peptidoglycan/xylan/chitin deacetylase (PgdA/CDA1 family)